MQMDVPDLPAYVGPFNPEASFVGDLNNGDMATFDPFFGMEQIFWITKVPYEREVFYRIQTLFSLPNESNTRFIVRAEYEPVTRWIPLVR